MSNKIENRRKFIATFGKNKKSMKTRPKPFKLAMNLDI